MVNASRPIVATLIALSIIARAHIASAQGTTDRSFAVQLFEPAIGRGELGLSVEPAQVADHLDFGLSFVMNYQYKPLSLFIDDLVRAGEEFDIGAAREVAVVRHQLSADLTGAVGFRLGWLRGQVGFGLPANLLLRGNSVDPSGEVNGELSESQLGDLRIQLKVLLLDRWKGLSLALSPIITAPTGDEAAFGGEENLTVRPRAVLDYRLGKLLLAANLGWLFRPEDARLYSSEIGDRLLYAVGAAYAAHQRVRLLAELIGQAGFSDKTGCVRDGRGDIRCSGSSSARLDAYPLELDLGADLAVGSGFSAVVAVGTGLIKAVGSPKVRVVGGIRWTPDFADADGDGVYDRDDRCPEQPEDRDGFEDSDGCPDPDNDDDGLPDGQDKCRDQPEDRDTYQDEDGCPDVDNDGDGIADINDACPFEAETVNEFKDDDGCPDVPDQDGDGVGDLEDMCPHDPEDPDKYEDADGCPDTDNDSDEVPDEFDSCPNEAEDLDGFEDDDGCPDPDNDGDGVPDARDRCPTKPETINGRKDDDGCPDRGRSAVEVTQDRIAIKERVYFATGRARIRRRSHNLLDQVALTLQANPEIERLRIEGHTDSRGDEGRNKRLSQARADAVRNYLVEGGVSADRLVSVGFGSQNPMESNKTRRGRAANRRVDFVILERR